MQCFGCRAGVLCSSADGPSCAAIAGEQPPQPGHVALSRAALDHKVPEPDGSDVILPAEGLLRSVELLSHFASSLKLLGQEQASKGRVTTVQRSASTAGVGSSEAAEAPGVALIVVGSEDELEATLSNAKRRQAQLGQGRRPEHTAEEAGGEAGVRVLQGTSHGSLEQAIKEALIRMGERLKEGEGASGGSDGGDDGDGGDGGDDAGPG